jgi:hypothetical protein
MVSGEIPADALVDLRTTNDELSVWRLEPDGSNLSALVAALASNKTTRVDKLDYVVLDEEVFIALKIRCVPTQGVSPHVSANQKYHCDLVELTAAKVFALANEVKRAEATHQRLFPKNVKEILQRALEAKALERSVMEPELLAELDR